MVDGWIKRWVAWGSGCTAILLVACLVLMGCGGSGEAADNAGADTAPAEPTTQTVTIKDMTFELELALDGDARLQGLSDRKEIAEDGGMLFVFPRPERAGFVMRRCYVPIDIIYIYRDGYIDSMHAMQVIEPIEGPEWHNPSKRYWSSGKIAFAIELKGGTLDKLDLKRGERIEMPYEALMSRAQ